MLDGIGDVACQAIAPENAPLPVPAKRPLHDAENPTTLASGGVFSFNLN